ncbi:MAG: serine/threonine protein kinase [Planctomycetes bacterium]|nr:serine/threonine protein kinase [Planctomycetota bacterium]
MNSVETLSPIPAQAFGYRPSGSLERGPFARAALREPPCGLLVPFPRRYRYLERLGRGAQGAVHLCEDLHLPGRQVAIKVARPRAEGHRLIERESRILCSLRSSHAVPEICGLLYRHGRVEGFVMSYIPGETLDLHLCIGPWHPERVISISLAAAESVIEVLSRGYLHRDLKPENLLVLRDDRVKLLDFGLACRAAERAGEGEISGTFAYAAPEQLEAKPLTPRSDLFSLGLILYEIATGRRFFSREADDYRAFVSYRARRLTASLDLDGVEPLLAALIRRLIVAQPCRRAGLREAGTLVARLRRSSPA